MDQQAIKDHKAYMTLFARARQFSIHMILDWLSISYINISYRKPRINNEILASDRHVHRQASHSCCDIIYFGQFF